jgi:hypothetical protein
MVMAGMVLCERDVWQQDQGQGVGFIKCTWSSYRGSGSDLSRSRAVMQMYGELNVRWPCLKGQ